MIFFNLRAEKPKFHFAYQFGILLGARIHKKKAIKKSMYFFACTDFILIVFEFLRRFILGFLFEQRNYPEQQNGADQ